MTATLTPTPVFQWINAQGIPLVGGQLFSYAAGTSTPLATYTDASGSVANTNPVILDASGSAQVWLGSASYKLVLQDTFSNVLWSVDNINATQITFLPSTGGTTYQPGANTTITVNSDAGHTSSFITNIGGTPSARFYSSSQGTGALGAADGTGTFNVDALQFDKFGNVVIGGNITAGSNTSTTSQFILNGAAGNNRFFFWQTAGKARWAAYADFTAESGSNSGSAYVLSAFDDTGAFLGNAFSITRSNQQVLFYAPASGSNFIATSDKNLKKNIREIPLKTCVKWVKGFKSYFFRWRKGGRHDIGHVAQQVRDVCPYLVHENAEGYLGIDYDKICAIHNTVLQDLLDRVEDLERK